MSTSHNQKVSQNPKDSFGFDQLIACEEEQLELAGSSGGKKEFDPAVAQAGAADEPWLVYTNRDRVGLALSGGGIRSATFNLGFLQALQQKKLLGLFDYLATVSGGGYTGGFWTAWRQHSTEKVPNKDPGSATLAPGDLLDPAAFATRLKGSADPVSVYLRTRLAAPTSKELTNWPASGSIPRTLIEALTTDLNAVILGPSIWNQARFAGVTLSPAAEKLQRENPTDRELAFFNRLLLDAAYPTAWPPLRSHLPLLFPRPTEDDLAPAATRPSEPPALRDNRERPEIRHLREFSRFLMPRLGVFEVEMWNGVVAVLGGLLPSLLFTTALTAVALLIWVQLSWWLIDGPGWLAAVAIYILTRYCIHGPLEKAWHKVNAAEPEELTDDSVYRQMTAAAALSTVFIAVGRIAWNLRVFHADPHPWWKPFTWSSQGVFAPLEWHAAHGYGAESAVLLPSLAWTAAGVVLLAWRFARFAVKDESCRDRLFAARALDRTIARCLAPAAIWAGLGIVWLAASKLESGQGFGQFAATGGAAAGLGTAFALLRRWLEQSVRAGGKAGWLDRIKPQLPKLIANAAVLAFVVFIAELLVALQAYHLRAWLVILGSCLLVIAGILRLMDPSRVGLHDFYRGRIARCFLGAANPDSLKATRPRGDFNRFTHERAKDDFSLAAIQQKTLEAIGNPDASVLPLRPIHLVCCAANNLAGDHLNSLYRGARSAVISQRGFSLGRRTRMLPELSFSSALTASASAFNSQMGHISMSLGPAVTFLMTALNLRLGLWLPNPASKEPLRPKTPGLFFLSELQGKTDCDPRPDEDPSNPGYVHISDGAHFENFGFYELIRRHCRYILVCDCGADPEGTFDDFARTLRRVREDFGVEVEIDLSPLRAGPDGLSAQHAAVGTIHYDGLTGADKGNLLFFKPVLTGDEPCDVEQYKRLNPDFPQQSTADQFYDEAQWESYRRLGEHSAHVVFRFADQLNLKHRAAAERVFYRASRQWQAGWRQPGEELLALSGRAADLEASIRDQAPAFLRAEFFPEAGAAVRPAPADPEAEARALFFLMQITQLMEDAWNLCRLGTEAQHPVNEGWLAYISRWAVTPSFRRWWPVLRAMYGYNFRQFINQRFDLDLHPNRSGRETSSSTLFDPGPKGRVILEPVSHVNPQGLAWLEWTRRSRQFSFERSQKCDPAEPRSTQRDWFELRLDLPSPDPLTKLPPLQVGFAVAERFSDGTTDRLNIARLHSGDFFIPDAFAGSGFIDTFLDELIHYYAKHDGITEMRVRLDVEMARPDPNIRQRRVQLIGFCKSRYFVYRRNPTGEPGADIEELCRDVGRDESEKPHAAAHVRVA